MGQGWLRQRRAGQSAGQAARGAALPHPGTHPTRSPGTAQEPQRPPTWNSRGGSTCARRKAADSGLASRCCVRNTSRARWWRCEGRGGGAGIAGAETRLGRKQQGRLARQVVAPRRGAVGEPPQGSGALGGGQGRPTGTQACRAALLQRRREALAVQPSAARPAQLSTGAPGVQCASPRARSTSGRPPPRRRPAPARIDCRAPTVSMQRVRCMA